jgi:nitronate monooxygenase
MTLGRQLGEREFVLRGRAYLPLVIGGMGVGISTKELALCAERIGAIGHLSDAMLPAEADRHLSTRFVAARMRRFKHNAASSDKSSLSFDLGELSEATQLYIADAVAAKAGKGALFVNCMEKLSMSDPRATLKVRLEAAMDAGIDGITLSAGLHLSTLALIARHPRFRDVAIGIVVSSLRALKLFLKRAARVERQPDYVIVEGPLAGGHLGFGEDWREHDLATIVTDILDFLKAEQLDIPVIAAGGIFTGDDAVGMLDLGCAAVQVATRFAIARESGLPDAVKQAYVRARDDDVVVNALSPTGYPMRMLRGSPALLSRVRPNCEAYGYLLDQDGNCAYLRDYWNTEATTTGESLCPRTCLCTEMRRFRVWTCGTTVSRLKTTLRRDEEGEYLLPSATEILDDYLWGREPDG